MKLFVTLAALGFAAVPQAAHAMECCKKDEGTAEPAPEGQHQH